VAVVEMAIVTPFLLMLLLGIVEFGYVFMIQQTLTNGVREACRTGSLPGATDAEIMERFRQSVSPSGLVVTAGMLTIQHATTANPVVTVSASVPYAQVSLLKVLPSSLMANWFSTTGGGSAGSKTLGSSCSMRKEGST